MRAHAPDGGADGAVLAERRRNVRRRVPALPRRRGRLRLGQGGIADDADDPERPAPARRASRSRRCSAPASRPRRPSPASRSCGASPSPSSRWSRLPTTSMPRSTAARSAGSRRASARRRSRSCRCPGVNQDIVITVAWDISWYQYRVTPDSTQPVRLAERGHEPDGARRGVHRVERPCGRRRPHRP